MLKILLLILGGLVVAGVLSLIYAMLLVSGEVTERDRRAYYEETGRWPEW